MADSVKKAVELEIKKMQLELSQVTRTTSLLNQNQIQKIWNSTPARFKYTRPAKGGGNWTYVKVSYVRKVLDSVFGFNWTFDVETSLKEAFDVATITGACVVKGTLIGYVKSEGSWVAIKKTQFGRAEVKWQMENSTAADGSVIYKVDSYGKRKPVKVRKIDSFSNSPVPLDFGNDMKAAASDCLKKCASLFGIGADVYEASEFQEIEIIGSDENNSRKKNVERKVKEAKEALQKVEADEAPNE